MYKFTPPAYKENPVANNRLHYRYLTPQGYAVAKLGTRFAEFSSISKDEMAEYDAVWLGGYTHLVSDEDGAALAAAGYNAVPVL